MTGDGSDRDDLRAVGDRLELLLDELRATLDLRAWELVEEAVGLVTDLYGGGLARVLDLVPQEAAEQLVEDDLIASLLVLHGLHPSELGQRVAAAIESVRPYMDSHGGGVEVLGIDEDDGVLHLRMLGSCDGCPSSSVTLQLAVKDALEKAAPEILHIHVVDETPPAAPTFAVELTRKPVPVR